MLKKKVKVVKFTVFHKCMSPWAKHYSIPTSAYILFLNITDSLEEVNDGVKVTEEISDTIVKIKYNQRYYKYATGASEINTFAYKITPVNEERFITFLSQNAFDVKSELFKNFKKKKKQIKAEGLFEDPEKCFVDIAATFSEIIADAEEAYKSSPRNLSWKERKSAVTNATRFKNVKSKAVENVSKDGNLVTATINSKKQVETEVSSFEGNKETVINTTESNDISPNGNNHSVDVNNVEHIDSKLSKLPASRLLQIDDYILELLMLIDNLLQTGEALAKEVNRNPMSKPYKSCSNWELLHDAYKQYTEKNVKLHALFNRYKCEVFEQVSQYKKSFTIDSFWRCNPMLRTRSWDTRGKIDEYMQKLSEISSAIENFKE